MYQYHIVHKSQHEGKQSVSKSDSDQCYYDTSIKHKLIFSSLLSLHG